MLIDNWQLTIVNCLKNTVQIYNVNSWKSRHRKRDKGNFDRPPDACLQQAGGQAKGHLGFYQA